MEESEQIDQEDIQDVIESVPRRCTEVQRIRGAHIGFIFAITSLKQ